MNADKADRALRDAFRDLDARPADDRWTAEEVFEAVHGNLPQKRVTELVDMAAQDSELADAFRIARVLPVQESSAGAPGTDLQSTPAGGRKGLYALVAAMAVIGLAWMAMLAPWDAMTPSTTRTNGGYEIQSEVASSDGQSRADFALAWTAGPEGTRYFLEASDLDLNVLYSKRHLDRAQIVVPKQALETLEAGDQVIWRVEAYLEDGRTVRSPTFRTRVID